MVKIVFLTSVTIQKQRFRSFSAYQCKPEVEKEALERGLAFPEDVFAALGKLELEEAEDKARVAACTHDAERVREQARADRRAREHANVRATVDAQRHAAKREGKPMLEIKRDGTVGPEESDGGQVDRAVGASGRAPAPRDLEGDPDGAVGEDGGGSGGAEGPADVVGRGDDAEAPGEADEG